MWNTETWQPVGDFMKGHKKEVMAVAFSPDGKLHRLGQRGRDGAAMGCGIAPTHR